MSTFLVLVKSIILISIWPLFFIYFVSQKASFFVLLLLLLLLLLLSFDSIIVYLIFIEILFNQVKHMWVVVLMA